MPTVENQPQRSSSALFKDAEFVALSSVMFVRGFVFAIILIALAIYADLFETSGIVAGLFGTAFALSNFFLVLPVGQYIDRGNPKLYLLSGLLLNVAVLVGFLVAGDALQVVVLRLVQGIGSLLILLPAMTVIGEISPDAAQGLWIGTANQVRAFSGFFGNLVGGLLLFRFGFLVTYTVSIAVVLGATALVYLFCRSTMGTRSTPDDPDLLTMLNLLLKRRTIRALVIFRFAFSVGKGGLVIFLPVFARVVFGMSAVEIGAIIAGSRLAKSLAQGRVGAISDEIGRHTQFIVLGTVMYVLGTALIPFASYVEGWIDPLSVEVLGLSANLSVPFLWLFAVYTFLGIADSLRLPTSLKLYIEEGKAQDAVARTLSIRSLAWQFGAVIGPLAFGGVLDNLSFFAAFFTAAGLVALSIVLFVVETRR